MTLLDPRILVGFLGQFVGGDYGFCDRCGGTCYDRQHDCSGLQCHGTNGTGLTRNVCTSSFVLATECYNLGLYMTATQAEADDGPDVFWAFHGANLGRTDDGSRPNGASGHIVLVVRVRNADGHTIGFYTIEAMGHAYGIVRGSYFGRGWTGRYRIPGVANRPPQPAPVNFLEPSMFIQAHHYNPKTGAIGAPTNPGHGNDPTIAISNDGLFVECRNDASIANDQPVAGHPQTGPGSLRRWNSPGKVLPPGVRFKAIVYRPPNADDSHYGGIALCTDGSERRFHLS